MMVALILAQLVLPWPGLDSPRVQPGPTICLGECAGPVVWGPAERGRLVVACDMRSDTCSDGRKITTTRATPVPCEVAPGQWEMVPADTGCYSVRGLEAWGQNTSYLAYGAELDRSPWGVTQQATISKQNGFYRISGVQNQSRVFQSLASPEAGDWTLSCIMRTAGSPNPRLRIYQEGASGGGFCNFAPSDEFSTYSCTQTITGTPTQLSIHIYSDIGHIDVIGCWLTKSDTPGRPCWGGEAPVTCAADRHTISTEGWPTEAGEISWVLRLDRLPRSGDSVRPILAVDSPFSNRITLTGSGSIHLKPNSTALDAFSPNLEWEVGRPYSMRLVFTPTGWKLYRDGSVVWSVTRQTEFDWGSVARVGQSLDGSISYLRIRSTP